MLFGAMDVCCPSGTKYLATSKIQHKNHLYNINLPPLTNEAINLHICQNRVYMAEKISTPTFWNNFFISTHIRIIAKMGKPKGVKPSVARQEVIGKSIFIFLTHILFLLYVFLKRKKSRHKRRKPPKPESGKLQQRRQNSKL